MGTIIKPNLFLKESETETRNKNVIKCALSDHLIQIVDSIRSLEDSQL